METTNNITSGNKDKIIKLLGQGLPPSVVATAVGLSESRISQLLSDESILAAVAELRMDSLQENTARDAKYDELEDSLLEKMKDVVPYLVRPGEILKALKTINEAKRRGLDPTERVAPTQSQTINLVLPQSVVSSFTANSIGQVVEAEHTTSDGTHSKQSLVTIQSGNVKKLLKRE